MPLANGAASATRAPLTGNAADLFDNLILNSKPTPTSIGMRPAPPPPYTPVTKDVADPARVENIPPRRPPKHRPTKSQEEATRARRAAAGPPGKGAPQTESSTSLLTLNHQGVRENSVSDAILIRQSWSAIMTSRLIRKRRRNVMSDVEESVDREREREGGKEVKVRKGKLDIIDQLDATSIYGTGLFHHDGPFDACNPHRNRPNSKRAPMQAFPKDSLNNIIGGGPLNTRPDHATFLGHNDDEAFKDYARSGTAPTAYESYNGARSSKALEPVVVSALQRVEPIHGDESLGLGTSTFLEGAPASRNAIQRRQTEELATPDAGGLQRKKSLAQKIRGISNNRRDTVPPGRINSPEGVYGATSPDPPTANGRVSSNEKNPFFKEFEAKEEKLEVKTDSNKEESIGMDEADGKTGRPRAPSSPRRGFGQGERLERRVTNDSTVEEPPKAGGFLFRVRSLKGKNKKPERPEKPT